MLKVKSQWGFCIVNDKKVPWMIALQFARGVTSTSEWRKTVNIFNYRSSKQFVYVNFSGY